MRLQTNVLKDIPQDQLEAQYNKPLVDAAKHLKVSVSTLKRICRRHGIARWPYRSISAAALQARTTTTRSQSRKIPTIIPSPTDASELDFHLALMQQHSSLAQQSRLPSMSTMLNRGRTTPSHFRTVPSLTMMSRSNLTSSLLDRIHTPEKQDTTTNSLVVGSRRAMAISMHDLAFSMELKKKYTALLRGRKTRPPFAHWE